MTTINRTPEQVNDYYEWAVNASELMNGRADAIAHIGNMLNGGPTRFEPEQIAQIQEDMKADASSSYLKGYAEAWNAMAGLLAGVAVDELHKL
jgi:hypothetical protein